MDSILNKVKQGDTIYGASSSQTIPTSPYDYTDLEGEEALLPDMTVANGATSPSRKRSAEKVKARLVRNTATFNLLPRRAAAWASGYRGFRVDGYTRTTGAEIAGFVDPHLPAAGVRPGDLFWLYSPEGPVEGLPDLAAGADNVFTVGDKIEALTAATSGATTAGRIKAWAGTFTVTQTTDGTATTRLQRVPTRAMTARTTANTLLSVLVKALPEL